MSDLYPPIHENHHFTLKVDNTHELYVEECGDVDGIPVIFLHGGPGAGCEPYHRQLFNPEKYRIILFDQRGCGRSTPHASLENNTTQHLIADMEMMRPQGNTTSLRLFTDYAAGSGADHVPDPYFTRDFDGALALIETASRGLIAHLQ